MFCWWMVDGVLYHWVRGHLRLLLSLPLFEDIMSNKSESSVLASIKDSRI